MIDNDTINLVIQFGASFMDAGGIDYLRHHKQALVNKGSDYIRKIKTLEKLPKTADRIMKIKNYKKQVKVIYKLLKRIP